MLLSVLHMGLVLLARLSDQVCHSLFHPSIHVHWREIAQPWLRCQGDLHPTASALGLYGLGVGGNKVMTYITKRSNKIDGPYPVRPNKSA